jgi:hypothetical protein
MNELDNRGVENGSLPFVAAEAGRPSTTPPGARASRRCSECSAHLGDQGHARLDVPDEFPFNSFEVVANRLKDLRQIGRERGILHCVGQQRAAR